jgi:flavodoxin
MKSLIIVHSHHHKNTEKIAQTMAPILGAEIMTLDQMSPDALLNYDLVGFGSGIYFGKFHKGLLEFADKLPQVNGKNALIFSTSGRAGKSAADFHKALRSTLSSKGYTILGEFSCPGFDTFGLLKIGGGIKKGRPNQDDLKQAETFAQSMQKNENKIIYLD